MDRLTCRRGTVGCPRAIRSLLDTTAPVCVSVGTALGSLSEPYKVATFDAMAGTVASLPAAMDSAGPDQLRSLVRLIVARVATRAGQLTGVEVKAAARPFFASAHSLLMAPPDGLQGTNRS
jgi:hypothetical protein